MPSDDRLSAALDEIRKRYRHWLKDPHGDLVSTAAASEVSAEDVPRLLAAVDGVLARHKPSDGTTEFHTLDKGWHSVTACAGCEEPWPCPDYEAITAALLGEEVPGG